MTKIISRINSAAAAPATGRIASTRLSRSSDRVFVRRIGQLLAQRGVQHASLTPNRACLIPSADEKRMMFSVCVGFLPSRACAREENPESGATPRAKLNVGRVTRRFAALLGAHFI